MNSTPEIARYQDAYKRYLDSQEEQYKFALEQYIVKTTPFDLQYHKFKISEDESSRPMSGKCFFDSDNTFTCLNVQNPLQCKYLDKTFFDLNTDTFPWQTPIKIVKPNGQDVEGRSCSFFFK